MSADSMLIVISYGLKYLCFVVFASRVGFAGVQRFLLVVLNRLRLESVSPERVLRGSELGFPGFVLNFWCVILCLGVSPNIVCGESKSKKQKQRKGERNLF